MGHATADDVVAHFRSALEGLLLNQILQISIDGPNVNWKFFEKFQGELKREFNVMLLNVGSCGLHVVHGAFKDGSKASGWDVDRFMGSAYWLFKDTPARREDYESTTRCKTFPMKFCQHRWLENGPVCERLIALLPHLEKYVKSVAEGKCPDPKTKSFDTVKQCVADPLLAGKLSFFLSVANQVTPFLTAYQTDKPMLPFLCADLYKMVRALMDRFVKDDVMSRVSSVQQLLKIDIGLKENHKVYSKIDIGFMAEKSLKSAVDQKTKKKISDKELMQFRMECKEFLNKLVKIIMEKSLARNMSSLDPREMGTAAKESNLKKFKAVLSTMNEANRVADNEVDELLQQYSKYIDDTVVPHASEYSNFEVSTGRVDVAYCCSTPWPTTHLCVSFGHV